jgi:hypothetical protein
MPERINGVRRALREPCVSQNRRRLSQPPTRLIMSLSDCHFATVIMANIGATASFTTRDVAAGR